MTRADRDCYAAKHPVGRSLNERVADAVRKRSSNGEISCADAIAIAEKNHVEISEVGVTIDLLEIRLKGCQLGLFGYGEKKRSVTPASQVSDGLEKAIYENLVDGRLPCLSAWHIADRTGISRPALSAACEALGIKIKPCQLGAF